MDVSFGTIWEAIARDQPDSVAISEPGRDYTFAEFDDRAARLAAALSAAGVGPGRQGGVLPLQRRRLPGDGVRRVQDRRRSGERELPVHPRRADRAAGRRRRRGPGVQRRPRGQRGARRAHAPVAAPARPGRPDSAGTAQADPGRPPPELAGPVRRDRAAPGRAAPRLRSALHVHRRHHRQAQGRDLAPVRPAASMQVSVFSRLGVDEPPGTLDEMVAVAAGAGPTGGRR